MPGIIYCGDNLEVLDEYVPRESVDLVYLDPPFNSQRTYNLIYKDQRAQEEAFKDYWSWEEVASKFHAIVDSSDVPKSVRTLLRALHDLLIENDSDQLAYLTMMTPRLVALYRALKPTGSMYLHCDPTASHYLKVILDAIFGTENFRNDIAWKRKAGRGETNAAAIRFGVSTDQLLFYAKGRSAHFERQHRENNPTYIASKFTHEESGRRYRLDNLTSPSYRPNLVYEYKGHNPPPNGWAVSRTRMAEMDAAGRLYIPADKGRRIQRKRYLDELDGETVDSLWDDIPPINSQAKERLGFPTQKPLALLDRILRASSRPGDLVLDAFCGCGTTVEAAERLGRRWIGIDIARKAVEVIEERFKNVGLHAPHVVWHPADPKSAEALAARDKLQFEEWILRKVRAARLRRKDRGIDGEAIYKEADGSKWHVLVSVKGGKHLAPTFVRDLRGTIEREGAAIGVLVSMFEPSKEMKLEAARAGVLAESDSDGRIPRIQLVTVEQLFAGGAAFRVPGVNVTAMPKPSVPPAPGSDVQLTLGLERPAVAKTRGVRKEQESEAAPQRAAVGTRRERRR